MLAPGSPIIGTGGIGGGAGGPICAEEDCDEYPEVGDRRRSFNLALCIVLIRITENKVAATENCCISPITNPPIPKEPNSKVRVT